MSQKHHVSLRPVHIADASVIALWAGDPRFCQEADWSVDLPVEEHVRFWKDMIEQPPEELLRLGAVQEGALVGYVELHGAEAGRRELGYVIGDRASWGPGLGGRAALAGLAYGVDCIELEEIWAEALDANEHSIRILQRLGMQEMGRGSDATFLHEPTFYRRFAIAAESWRASPPAVP